MSKIRIETDGDTGMVTRIGVFDIQVCVPKSWTEKQIMAFAEEHNPCGTTGGWSLRRKGSDLLGGDDERQQCDEVADRVHIMLDA